MVTAAAAATTTRPGHRSRYWIPGIALAVVLTAAAVYDPRLFHKRAPGLPIAATSATAIRTRRSVAVLGFRNLPGRAADNWLSLAFSEMLNTELASDGALRMLPGEDVARVKRDLPLADEDSLAKATLDRLRISPGADLRSEVASDGALRMLPGEDVARVKRDLPLADEDSLAKATLDRLRISPGADL